MLFINLPVRDLPAARDFYQAFGCTIHDGFSDEETAALVVDDSLAVMLHTRERFADLVTGEVGDPSRTTTVVHCLTTGSREEVDDRVATALRAGAGQWLPVQKDDYRYTGSFTDPDGHVWQVMCMDTVHVID